MAEWTAEREALLTELHKVKGMPYIEIAGVLGITKNAVVGKIHRLGLSKSVAEIDLAKRMRLRKQEKKKAAAKKPEKKKPSNFNRFAPQLRSNGQRGPVYMHSTSAKVKINTSERGIALPYIKDTGQCRGILRGEGKDIIYCGKPTAMKVRGVHSYCLAHLSHYITKKGYEQAVRENTKEVA